MKTYATIALTAILLLATITSCIRDDNDLSKCFYRIKIEQRWIDSEPVRANDSTQLEIKFDGNSRSLNSGYEGRYVDLIPNIYDIIGFEPTHNVSINNNIVSVSVNSDGSAMEPGPFTAGEISAEVYSVAEDQLIILPMRRQTRELIVKVKITGDGLSLINGMTGSLSGIAISREVNSCFPPVDGKNRPSAARSGVISYSFQEDTDQWFVGSNTLLGIDGNSQQNLSLNINFINGEATDISQDVTGGMTGFHTQDIAKPWYIIIEINLGFDLQATITDWSAGPYSWLIAE